MKKILFGLTIGFFILGMIGAGNAIDIDLDACSNGNTNPVSLFLSAGTYNVTPIRGFYTTWNPWGYVILPDKGWTNIYGLASAEFTAYTVGDEVIYETADEALANALSTSFTLSSDGYVDFYIEDSFYPDNIGGISLDVSPATKPSLNHLIILLLSD